MKKILLGLTILGGLSSCAMHPDSTVDQQIFYGEKLVDYDKVPTEDLKNSSFIYLEDLEDYDDCGIIR